MQIKILKMKIVLCIIMALLLSNCTKKSDLENQITIKINLIDSKTKEPRADVFDTIDVRMQGIGYLMKTFNKVGEYVTDSTGSVKIKVDRTEEYYFIVEEPNIYGSIDFTKGELKNDQEVNIEVMSLENR